MAAWQRALAQQGLTAGRFYRVFARDMAPIEDEQVRDRLERKRDEDLADIEGRIRQVEVERAYRVVGVLEKTARHLREEIVPRVADARRLWRRRTLALNGAVFGVVVAVFLGITVPAGLWNGPVFEPLAGMELAPLVVLAVAVLLLGGFVFERLRALAGRWVLRNLARKAGDNDDAELVRKAFAHNLKGWWLSPTSTRPRGWTRRSRRLLETVLGEADGFVQALNDRYARPSGPRDDEQT